MSAKVGEALGWGNGSSTAGDLKGLGLRSQAGDCKTGWAVAQPSVGTLNRRGRPGSRVCRSPLSPGTCGGPARPVLPWEAGTPGMPGPTWVSQLPCPVSSLKLCISNFLF